MKHLNLILIGSSFIGITMSFSAFADMGHKAPLAVNFNRMIENSSDEKARLEDKVGVHYQDEEIVLEDDDSQRVTDFVDVEVQWGKQENQVVDRRFNSLGEPTLVKEVPYEEAQSLQVTLKKSGA
jgi:hypothetical protein